MKKLFSTLIIICMVFSCISMVEFDIFASDDDYYSYPQWQYSTLSGELYYTKTIMGRGTSSAKYWVAWNSAYKDKLSHIYVSEDVTLSGFSECTNLQFITLNGVYSVNIAENAFYDCKKLQQFWGSGNIRQIGKYAFYGCSNLESFGSISIYGDIGDYTFAGCTSLKKIYFAHYVGYSMKIGKYAFSECTNLSDYGFSSYYGWEAYATIDLIDNYAFNGCTKITYIPQQTVTVCENAFYGCTGIENLSIGMRTELINNYSGSTAWEPKDITIQKGAFNGCTEIKTLYINNNVANIEAGAFHDCNKITTVTVDSQNAVYCGNNNCLIEKSSNSLIFGCSNSIIPGTVIKINDSAFSGCTGLIDITIPNSVTSIETYAFSECTGLTNIDIPNSVTSIGDSAFSGCTGLTNITIPSSVIYIGNNAFSGCTKLNQVNASSIFSWCRIKFCNSYSNPLYYAHNLYVNNSKIVDLNIPSSTSYITAYAFINCNSLKNITIPNSISSIGDGAFSGCSNAKLLIVDNSYAETYAVNNSIPYVFYPKYTLADNITASILASGKMIISGTGEIPNYNLFSSTPWYDSADLITDIEISEGITGIGTYSFYGCNNLKNVCVKNKYTAISKKAFDTTNTNLTFYCPNDSVAETYCTNNNISCVLPLSAPTVKDVTGNSISVNIENNVQYTIAGWGWNTTGVFTELSPVTEYKIYAERIDTGCEFGLEISEPLIVSTTKNTVSAPSAPAESYHSDTKIVLNENSSYEYSLDGENWQNSNIFEGLTKGLVYKFYQRYAETDTTFASPASEPLTITMIKKNVAAPNAPTVDYHSDTKVVLNSTDGYEYSIDGINWQTSSTFDGLTVGKTYSFYQRIAETETEYASPASKVLTVKMIKKSVSAPDAPTFVSSNDTNNISFTANSLYEYSIDGENWQKSSAFTGLEFNKIYKAYQRIAETETEYASPASEPYTFAFATPAQIEAVGCETIRVVAVDGFEYSLDAINWQTSTTFSGLVNGMDYFVYQRMQAPASGTYYNPASVETSVTVDENHVDADGKWEYNTTQHYHTCACGEKIDYASHVYDNACDTTCNVCGAVRTITHDYQDTWSSDGTQHWHECSVCGDITEVAEHEYDNACDTTCNVCGAVRTITHNYKDTWSSDETQHWHECSVCGDETDILAHIYSNACDTTCNVCGYTRTITHNYKEAWSSDSTQHWHECSVCGDKTDVAKHIYDDDDDTTCNTCGYVREIQRPLTDKDSQIYVESKKVNAGKEFTVSVEIRNNPGFTYLEITPVYSNKLTLVSVANGTLLSNFTQAKQYSWVADRDVTSDGTLMTFTFSTNKDVEPDDYSVSFIVRSCVNYNEDMVKIAVNNGIISVTNFIYGDANGDEIINGQDVVRIIKYLANYDYGTGTSTIEIYDGADANGDGIINGQDIVRLKKYLANYDYDLGTSTITLGLQN